jgi:preprotein translocase subunit SecD
MKSTAIASLVILALLSPTYSFAADPLTLEVASAQRGHDLNDQIVLDVRLSDNSRRLFASWTGRHVNKTVHVLIDGRVVSTPRLVGEITGGVLEVIGPSRDEINAWIGRLTDGRSVLSVESED